MAEKYPSRYSGDREEEGAQRKPLPRPAESMLEDALCSGNAAAWDAKAPGAAWIRGIYEIPLLTRLPVVHGLMGFCNPHLTGIPVYILLTF